MKKSTILVLLAALILPLIASCTMIIPSGVIVERDYYFQNFDSVVVSSSFNATITPNSVSSTRILIDQAAADYLDVHQIGTTLYLGLQPGAMISGDFQLQANIAMPALTSINASGASTISANNFNPPSLFVDISGASTGILGNISITQGNLVVSGASTLRSTGNTSVSSSTVNVSGASTLRIPVLNYASGSVSGASTFVYGMYGPTINVNVSGASSCRPF